MNPNTTGGPKDRCDSKPMTFEQVSQTRCEDSPSTWHPQPLGPARSDEAQELILFVSPAIR